MRQMLGGLFGCGWTVEDVLDLSFDQMREVSRCVYAHKYQMINSVLEPIAQGLNKGSGKGKRSKFRRQNLSRSGSTTTQKDLRNSGLSAEQRDVALINKLNAMGFNVS